MIATPLFSHRSLVMVAAAFAVVAWFWYGDPSGGRQLQEQLRTLLGGLTALGLAYLGRKSILPGDAKEAWGLAMLGSLPHAILVLAVAILTGMLFLGFIPRAPARQCAARPSGFDGGNRRALAGDTDAVDAGRAGGAGIRLEAGRDPKDRPRRGCWLWPIHPRLPS